MQYLANQKQQAAQAALQYIPMGATVGIGTGSTVNYFIDLLTKEEIREKIVAVVASSNQTAHRLRAMNLPLVELNSVNEITLYVDGADEINDDLAMIKGGGAALTGEKIVASQAKQFICIADVTKKVAMLGKFPLPIEVIPTACNHVARSLAKLGGKPIYREGVITDYGNSILDIWHLSIPQPEELEIVLNNIPGIVTNGIFALRKADLLLLGTTEGVQIYSAEPTDHG